MPETGRRMPSRVPLSAWVSATLLALGATFAPADAGITDPTLSVPEPPLALPGAGSTFLDPAFGSTMSRMLDAQASGDGGVAVPEYSKLQAWNADMSLIMLRSTTHGHSIVRATPPYTRIATLAGGAQSIRWSPTDPDLLYYLRDDNNQLWSFRVSTRQSTVVRTFPEYTSFSRDECYEEMSNDGRYIALAGILPTGEFEIFAYDVINGVKHTPLRYPNYTGSPGNRLNWCVMAPSGRYVLVLWNPGGVTRYQGLEAFDLEMNYLGKVHAGTGHSDFVLDADGRDYVVVDGANDWNTPLPGQMLVKARVPDGITFNASGQPDYAASIANGGQVPLVQMNARNNGAFGTHTSCRNIRLHGQAGVWCVVSTEVQVDPTDPANGWIPFQGEIFRVYMDSRDTAPHVERLVHHRSRIRAFPSDGCTDGDLYWSQPHATISPDGAQVLFGSNWHRICDPTDPADPYLITVGPPASADTTPPAPPAGVQAR